jgi:hypothetical protein
MLTLLARVVTHILMCNYYTALEPIENLRVHLLATYVTWSNRMHVQEVQSLTMVIVAKKGIACIRFCA